MNNRRDFIKTATAATVGTAVMPTNLFDNFGGKSKRAFGVQLFTFMFQMGKDPKGTLKRVAELGYTEIESAFSGNEGFYGMATKDFKAYIADLGIQWRSHHVLGAPFKLPEGMEMPKNADGSDIVIPKTLNLKENMQQLVDQVAESGVSYAVCSSIPVDTIEETKHAIEILNRSHEAFKKVGVELGFHNHKWEFVDNNGQKPYDLLLSETELVMELDVAWSIQGGADPIALIDANPGRFPLWHVKDFAEDGETVVSVGTGKIDYEEIFKHAEKAGLKQFYVEHDMPKDGFESIATSYAHLSKFI